MIIGIIRQTKTKAPLFKAASIHVFIFLVVTLLAGICAPSLYADIYSWTDKNGVKHFSNVPPPPSAHSTVDVRREHIYDEAADEKRWELEQKEWDALQKELKNTEKQEVAANKTEAEKKDESKNLNESIEREKSRLQIEIKRLEKMPATSFPEQLDGKRAAIAFYRSRLQALEDDPERYFKSQ